MVTPAARPCEWCGELFTPKTDRARYHSRACHYAARDHAKSPFPDARPGDTLTAVCVDCGRAFEYIWTRRPRKRCETCRTRPSVAATLAERRCAWCGVPFMPKDDRHLFCRSKCRYDHKNAARPSQRRAVPWETRMDFSAAAGQHDHDGSLLTPLPGGMHITRGAS